MNRQWRIRFAVVVAKHAAIRQSSIVVLRIKHLPIPLVCLIAIVVLAYPIAVCQSTQSLQRFVWISANEDPLHA